MSRHWAVTGLQAHEYDDNLYHKRPGLIERRLIYFAMLTGKELNVPLQMLVCFCVCVIMHDFATGIHSSLPRSEKEAVFINHSRLLCIQKEFTLCSYKEDITMVTVLVVQRCFSGSSTMDLTKVLFLKDCIILLSVQKQTKTKHLV